MHAAAYPNVAEAIPGARGHRNFNRSLRAWRTRSNATGEITNDDIEAHQNELRNHPCFRPDMAQLVDLRRARMLPTYEASLRLSRSAPFSAGARRAIVVPDRVHYGVLRQASVLGGEERGTLVPFLSLDQACDWLDIPLTAIVAFLEGEGGGPAT